MVIAYFFPEHLHLQVLNIFNHSSIVCSGIPWSYTNQSIDLQLLLRGSFEQRNLCLWYIWKWLITFLFKRFQFLQKLSNLVIVIFFLDELLRNFTKNLRFCYSRNRCFGTLQNISIHFYYICIWVYYSLFYNSIFWGVLSTLEQKVKFLLLPRTMSIESIKSIGNGMRGDFHWRAV